MIYKNFLFYIIPIIFFINSDDSCALFTNDANEILIICDDCLSYKFNTSGGVVFTTYGISKYKVENGNFNLDVNEIDLVSVKYSPSERGFSTIDIKCDDTRGRCLDFFEIEIKQQKCKSIFLERDSMNRFIIESNLLDKNSCLDIAILGLGFKYDYLLKVKEPSNINLTLKTNSYIPSEISKIQLKKNGDTLFVNSIYSNWNPFYRMKNECSCSDIYNYMDWE